MAFKNSSDSSGISVISLSCITSKNRNICEHIHLFYKTIIGTPIIFWEFEDNILPQNSTFQQSPSATGDDCHYNIKNLTNREARKIIIKQSPSAFQVCIDKKIVPFSEKYISS